MVENSTSESTAHTDPPSASEAVAKLRLELNHHSLEKLEKKGLVRWDRDKHVVKKGPKFEEKNPGEAHY